MTAPSGGVVFSSQTTANIIASISPSLPPVGTSNTVLATTQFVQTAIAGAIFPLASAKAQYYYNLPAGTTSTFALQETIAITGLAVGNFFTSTYVPNNNFITVRYTYQTFSADLATVYSSTGDLMLFPQRIAGQVPYLGPEYFGYPPSKDYYICNLVGRPPAFPYSSAFNMTSQGGLCDYGIPYWNSAPAQGQNSGYPDMPDTIFMTGSANGTGASFGFSIFQPVPNVGWTVSFVLEVLTNPFPFSVGVALLPSVFAP